MVKMIRMEYLNMDKWFKYVWLIIYVLIKIITISKLASKQIASEWLLIKVIKNNFLLMQLNDIKQQILRKKSKNTKSLLKRTIILRTRMRRWHKEEERTTFNPNNTHIQRDRSGLAESNQVKCQMDRKEKIT